ncbi:hypothetical protein SAMN05421781_1360 [Marinococcus luteus]|uniref:Uncharacterized protein n=1 Tax=Marinococcus luteus TaxID=1122204 RepID=A0A1H2TEJ7_9BACI|nr:hypothetical protein [Marinococcus luteus]SDW42177.1 hypothetical protein SAMN05421781_1360 [Marinococcus luteus]
MPIPFIAAGAAAVSAVAGTRSGWKSLKDSKEAKLTKEETESIVETAENDLDVEREMTHLNLEALGKNKIEVLTFSVKDFIENFEKLKNVDFQDNTVGIEELKEIGVSEDLLNDLEAESFEAIKLAKGGAASIGAGAAAAYGAYSGAMALGTASTGTAIGGLSGVAAQNATLAWLGGGALSAGGYGMAGGMVVLGGLVAGPAMAVGGFFLQANSKKKLNEAYERQEEAKVYVEQLDSAVVVLSSIQQRSTQLITLLLETDRLFKKGIANMEYIIERSGTDWSSFEQEEKRTIHRVFLIAQLIKGIIDTPLLDEDGEITEKSKEVLENGNIALSKFKK